MAEKDEFVNQAYLAVTESGTNTLTFSKLETGISIHEKVGWVIARVDYSLPISSGNFTAEGDGVLFGLSTSDAIAAVSLGSSAVIDYNEITRRDMGTAASGIVMVQPFTKDFSKLPGGGILVPPNPLFTWVQGVSLAGAMALKARMFYTVKQLKLEDFWELVELRRMIGT